MKYLKSFEGISMVGSYENHPEDFPKPKKFMVEDHNLFGEKEYKLWEIVDDTVQFNGDYHYILIQLRAIYDRKTGYFREGGEDPYECELDTVYENIVYQSDTFEEAEEWVNMQNDVTKYNL